MTLRLLQIILLIASASAVFVVGAVITTSLLGPDAPSVVAAPTLVDPVVEIRLSSPGSPTHVFVGQPLIVHVELINLGARRARRQIPIDPTASAPDDEILLDEGLTPWEHRVAVTVTSDETIAISRLEPGSHLLNPDVIALDRRLGLAPARATFVIEGPDLSNVSPGQISVTATLPAEVVLAEHTRVIPLTLDLRPTPTNDPDRAHIGLAVARLAALRGESAAAIEAALTALALDPLQDDALRIIAESWEQQGDLAHALEWYDRYLETIPDADTDQRAALEAYVRALRRQR